MPDRRVHRGAHPDDARLFSREALPALRQAAADYCWLLSGGYAEPSALKLVGDRHCLLQRQRIAVARFSCSDESLRSRTERRQAAEDLADCELMLDGFNVLVTVEAALSGGVVLHARDECYRDLASMHGTYRRAAETQLALELLGKTLQESGAICCRWLLDSPVSNSGRLAQRMRQLAADRGWPWEIELVADPDAALAASSLTIATADSGVLSRSGGWLNLARLVIERHVPQAWVVDLNNTPEESCPLRP